MQRNPFLLSVVIPVFNEEQTVCELLNRVLAVQSDDLQLEIILVNDGSTDRSDEVICDWIARNGTKVSVQYLQQNNAGKGAALRAGIAVSHGGAVIVQDADLEYDPQDYRCCIAPIRNGEHLVVYGSREESNHNRIWSSPFFYLGSLSLTLWMDLIFNANLTDEATCYKTFDGTLIRTLAATSVCNGFDWEPEITAKLLRIGIHPYEVPVSYHPRMPEAGKKIRFRDGFVSMWVALQWRFASVPSQRTALISAFPQRNRMFASSKTEQVLLLLLLFVSLLLCPDTLGGDTPACVWERIACSASVFVVYLTCRIRYTRLWSLVFGFLYLLTLRFLPGGTEFPFFLLASTIQMGLAVRFSASGFFPFFLGFALICSIASIIVPYNALFLLSACLFLCFMRDYKFLKPCLSGGVAFFLFACMIAFLLGDAGTVRMAIPSCNPWIYALSAVLFIVGRFASGRKEKQMSFRQKAVNLFGLLAVIAISLLIHPLLFVPYLFCLYLDPAPFRQS